MKINLNIISNKKLRDADQTELTVETILNEFKEVLKDSQWREVYLDGDYIYFIQDELKSFKHKDFKKVWKEIITNYKNKLIQLAKDVNVIRYTDERGKGPSWFEEFVNLLIKNYFKYVITMKGHATFWYKDKGDAIMDINEMYNDYARWADNPDPKEFMKDYKLKGFTYMPSND